MTAHAWLRQTGRDIDPRLIAVAEHQAYSCSTDTAIRLAHGLPKHQASQGDGTNGDEVWAIVRHQTVVTLMYRRSTQPKTPDAFDVREIKIWN